MNPSYPPDLSVVVITGYGANHLERCLISLDKQSDGAIFETIVACDEIIENISALKERFPLVRFHQVQGRTTEEKLLAIGICQSRGKVVALTADHCTPEKHWCARIIGGTQKALCCNRRSY